jgi:hypothetical protein
MYHFIKNFSSYRGPATEQFGLVDVRFSLCKISPFGIDYLQENYIDYLGKL